MAVATITTVRRTRAIIAIVTVTTTMAVVDMDITMEGTTTTRATREDIMLGPRGEVMATIGRCR